MPLRGYENNLVRQASQRTKMGISDLPRKSISGINMIYTAAPTAQSQLVVRAGETGSRLPGQHPCSRSPGSAGCSARESGSREH